MENTKEIWKDIVGYEGLYQVSNLGNIRSLERRINGSHNPDGRIIKERLRKPLVMKNKYVSINLIDKKSGKSTRNSVHRFVAEAFIPNPFNKPCVNHIDGNKHNNNVDNLEWCTYSENMNHAVKTGLQKSRTFTEEQKQKLREINKEAKNLLEWKEKNKEKVIAFALAASLSQVKKVNQIGEDGILIKQWSSITEASKGTGASLSTISRCAKGKQKTSKGFKWEYAQ